MSVNVKDGGELRPLTEAESDMDKRVLAEKITALVAEFFGRPDVAIPYVMLILDAAGVILVADHLGHTPTSLAQH